MKLSEMKELLAQGQIRLTKSLGQNFLHDANQLRRIVAAGELCRQDKVLEIGPGLGPLTELLLAQAGEVLAIEKDQRLVEVLQERFHPPAEGRSAQNAGSGSGAALQLLHDDALDYLRREPRDWSAWKLVANLPYSVSSPILVELARGSQSPQRMVATLQLEVARRLMSGPGSSDYGVLTLLVQLDYQPKTSFKIPATCFFPEPDVASTCVVLVRRDLPLVDPGVRKAFVQIVKRSFSQRRKMMLKLLKQDWPAPALATAFEQARLAPQTRAEAVSLDQFVQLARILQGARK